eukprot:CAMPEP_0174276898 /NCGR_PEP_ID=MMETSP0439-20130205/60637_1 /TAXON_ID=0 /ORGANISM="Stereomyxa ramosa, Strain Chinc5" /LENGTH=261 /DNA_ID=CAMNT_0015369169 /DNA_START=42 /DNA_END=827 /DNA_ORIENTATION=+
MLSFENEPGEYELLLTAAHGEDFVLERVDISRALIEEQNEEVAKVMKDAKELQEIMEALHIYTKEDEGKLNFIDKNVTNADFEIEKANKELETTYKYKIKNWKLKGAIGGMVGGAAVVGTAGAVGFSFIPGIGTVVGLVSGAVVGGVTGAITGGLAGYGAASVLDLTSSGTHFLVVHVLDRVEPANSSSCHSCDVTFLGQGGLKKRHHCRICGASCCSNCCVEMYVIARDEEKAQKGSVCTKCAEGVDYRLGQDFMINPPE